MRQDTRIFGSGVTAFFAALLLGACTPADSPTAPRALPTGAERGFIADPTVWEYLTTPRQADYEFVEVCKDFTGAAMIGSTSTFTVSGTATPAGASAQAVGPFDLVLGSGECRELYVAEFGTTTNLTIAETGPSISGMTTLVNVTTISKYAATTYSGDVSATSAAATTGPGFGSLVIFTNSVPETAGCTRTLGFWKTHSELWDAAGDVNTAAFIAGASFFSSGQTYLETLNTPPKGDAYYILAHQYIVALLNGGGGAAATAEVNAAVAGAQAFFGGTSELRATLIGWAEQLAAYNEGLAGPGHCP